MDAQEACVVAIFVKNLLRASVIKTRKRKQTKTWCQTHDHSNNKHLHWFIKPLAIVKFWQEKTKSSSQIWHEVAKLAMSSSMIWFSNSFDPTVENE